MMEEKSLDELNEMMEADLRANLRDIFQNFGRTDIMKRIMNLSNKEMLAILFMGFSEEAFFDQVRMKREIKVIKYPREECDEILFFVDGMFRMFDANKKRKKKK